MANRRRNDAQVVVTDSVRYCLHELRVVELKTLLTEFCPCKPSPYLRKADLLQKAFELFQSGGNVTPIIERVKQLADQRWGLAGPAPPPNPVNSKTVGKASPKHPILDGNIPFFERWNAVAGPLSTPVHCSWNKTVRTLSFKFKLTKAMLSRKRAEDKLHLLLLFTKSAPSTCSEEYIRHPSGYSIHVNGIGLHSLPGDGESSKYQLPPLDITDACRLSPGFENTVTIVRVLSRADQFNVSVELGRRRSPLELVRCVELRPNVSNGNDGRSLIKKMTSKTPKASDISLSSGLVPLSCPLSAKRLVHPGRAMSCEHLACFDVAVYLEMNETRPKWLCPICKKPAKPGDLFIDALMTEVLSKTATGTNRVEILPNGSWQAVEDQPTSGRGTKRKSDCNPSSSKSGQPAKRKKVGEVTSVIDLTELSDGESPPKRKKKHGKRRSKRAKHRSSRKHLNSKRGSSGRAACHVIVLD